MEALLIIPSLFFILNLILAKNKLSFFKQFCVYLITGCILAQIAIPIYGIFGIGAIIMMSSLLSGDFLNWVDDL